MAGHRWKNSKRSWCSRNDSYCLRPDHWYVVSSSVPSNMKSNPSDLVPLIQVAAWRSYVNVVSTLGRSIGGPLGGLLADTIGWRWSFIGQGPLILLAIMLVALKLPSRSSTDQVQQKGKPSKLRRIDFVGAFMLAVTIVALLGALSLGGQNLSWSHPIVIGLTIGAVVLGCLFVTYETKYALEPVFPPTLVVRRDVATPYAIVALQVAAQLAVRPLSPSAVSSQRKLTLWRR